MSAKSTIKVAGVESDIITEKNVDNVYYYLEEGIYMPISIKCRMLKVKRNKQILFVSYTFIIIKGKEFPCFNIAFNKQELCSDISEWGQSDYNYALQAFDITEVYRMSDNQAFKMPNDFNTLMPTINEIIMTNL